MACATLPQLPAEIEIIKAICEPDRPRVQRNTVYEPIIVRENAPTVIETELPSNKSKVLEDNLAMP
jgi:hypothetical protein